MFILKTLIEEIPSKRSPLELFSRIKDRPYSFFLDSSLYHDRLGRYSFMGCDPFLVFKSKGEAIRLEWAEGRVESLSGNPFFALKDIFNKYRIEINELTPFASGAAGYFAYDLKNFVEELPDKAKDDLGISDCMIGFYDVVMTCDNLTNKFYISSSGFPEIDIEKNRIRRIERSDYFKNILEREPSGFKASHEIKPPRLISNFSKEAYAEAVMKAKEYIKAGDIYQVNLSQRFEAELSADPFDIYTRLREISPAPFAAYLNFNEVTILSSSPERFLLKQGDYIETRPIKGTRPRGSDNLMDQSLEKELSESAKDRAEHVMIVDLERNDIGRICEYGSVRPDEFVVMEKYSTVFHLVSTVSGRLRKDEDPIDCLLATFPGGSITGAPKIRSMEIIEELEPVKRGIYTGAIGYMSFDGNMDTSIVIRTFIIKDGRIYFQVGGGIVADSDPEKEYEETLHKASGLMRSLGVPQKRRELLSV